jgi:hypothetical protein
MERGSVMRISKRPMKRVFAIAWILFAAINCCAQKQFTLSSGVGNTTISINGKNYQLDSASAEIPTHYPRFDTLIFRDRENTPILCNFKPDSSYIVIGACCGSFDIVNTSKLRNDSLQYWSPFENIEKIHTALMDKPFISIRTKVAPTDSIYAFHEDAACNGKYKRIDTTLWRPGVPPKCVYWTNVTTITFVAQKKEEVDTDLEEFLGLSSAARLCSVSFRLFDDERFLLIYDEHKNSVELTYE